jgi:hypothetical protein
MELQAIHVREEGAGSESSIIFWFLPIHWLLNDNSLMCQP